MRINITCNAGAEADYLRNVIFACQKIVNDLGKLGSVITDFNVDVTGGLQLGVRWEDPMGRECGHSTGYEFMGSGKNPKPKIEEIHAHFMSNLAWLIRRHLEKCPAKVEDARKAIEDLLKP